MDKKTDKDDGANRVIYRYGASRVIYRRGNFCVVEGLCDEMWIYRGGTVVKYYPPNQRFSLLYGSIAREE